VGLHLSEEYGEIEIGSHHLLLTYLSFSREVKEVHKKALSQRDDNGFIQIEIKFETEGTGLEVTKCGAHLVYEEDLNQTMGGCRITPYEDDVDDSFRDDYDGMSWLDDDVDDSFCDYYDGDELAGPLNSDDVDVPHPKRIRLLNLIERFIPRLGNWMGNSSTQGQLGNSDCEEEEEGS
jgi:hypothetical protein